MRVMRPLTFASTAVHHKGGSDFTVEGDLTIAGVTKPVTLELEYDGSRFLGDPGYKVPLARRQESPSVSS